MYQNWAKLPVAEIEVELCESAGRFEGWRHAIGHGGINWLPLPENVAEGARALKPRLLRTFVQEYFSIYPEHGVYDWSRLDPYMESLSRTGADIVASIAIKPPILYPVIDESVWKPNDVREWQQVIEAVVHRYSVEKRVVTCWEIGNEPDIGEQGGSPYLFQDANDYMAYYRFTAEAVLRAFPEGKVGGPAVSSSKHPLLSGFIDLCYTTGTQLDFVSWHVYDDDPHDHRQALERIHAQLAKFGDRRPTTYVTEWNKGFDYPVSVEEMAYHPRRAAATAATIVAMTEAGIGGSFYYHVWDQTFYPEQFRSFYRDLSIMNRHWNEFPHRFGLFGVGGEVRPPYFVYRMLARMDGDRLAVRNDDPDLWILAAAGREKWSVLVASYSLHTAEDKLVNSKFMHLPPGVKQLTVYRIDGERGRLQDPLALPLVEQRVVDIPSTGEFCIQTLCPADSVTLVELVEYDLLIDMDRTADGRWTYYDEWDLDGDY